MADPDDQELYTTIDREARDDGERRDSKVIYEALKRRRDDIGGAAEIPTDDKQLSERILNAARTRSTQLSSARASAASGRPASTGAPIPWWLIVAWIVAIAGVAAAWWSMR